MVRLLLYLLGKVDYESCKSCETLKEQLQIANYEREQLTATLLGLLKPTIAEAPVREVEPIIRSAGTFARRRAAAEEADRIKASLVKNSPIIGVPDNLRRVRNTNEPQTQPEPDPEVEKLERELGVGTNE